MDVYVWYYQVYVDECCVEELIELGLLVLVECQYDDCECQFYYYGDLDQVFVVICVCLVGDGIEDIDDVFVVVDCEDFDYDLFCFRG